MKRTFYIVSVLALVAAGCNQSFEPDGPVNSKLVVYGILNSRSDTQYVRLSSTYGTTPPSEIKDAAVTVTGDGRSFTFRDTTVLWRDSVGNLSPTDVYVAYHAPMKGGALYQLQVSTPSGLVASSSTNALNQPSLTLKTGTKPGFFMLNREFKTVSGAAILHFYLDYYVLVNNGWELRTEEVPSRRYLDAAGNEGFLYPSFGSVATLATAGTDVAIDSTLFLNTQSRVHERYQPAPVVDLDIRFVLTQIDDFLYRYYYLPNGAVDQSTIRLDVPDFTNIRGGYGVFGSRAEAILFLPFAR